MAFYLNKPPFGVFVFSFHIYEWALTSRDILCLDLWPTLNRHYLLSMGAKTQRTL